MKLLLVLFVFNMWKINSFIRKYSLKRSYTLSNIDKAQPSISYSTTTTAITPTDIPTIILLEPEEKDIISSLKTFAMTKTNCTVRIAGGWVRDKLLHLATKPDIDIAVDHISGVQFARQYANWTLKSSGIKIDMGVIQSNPDKSKHLETAAFQLGKYSIDVVNLRTENYCNDSRIPIIQIGTPSEDAYRRDLTINALFYNINEDKIEDFTGLGLQDLRDGIIRTPLSALITLKDDPLRALRAIRFACRFHFQIIHELLLACADYSVHYSLHAKISKERIAIELNYMLNHHSSYERAIQLLYETGLLHQIICFPKQPQKVTQQSSIITTMTSTVAPINHILDQGVLSLLLYSICAKHAIKFSALSLVFTQLGDSTTNLFARESRLALLLNFGLNYTTKSPRNAKKTVSLSEYILLDLRMGTKDISYVLNACEMKSEYQSLIYSIINQKTTTLPPPTTSSTNNSIINNDNSNKGPMYQNIISREVLGLFMMRSKEHYRFHILFALIDAVVQSLTNPSSEEQDISVMYTTLLKQLQNNNDLSLTFENNYIQNLFDAANMILLSIDDLKLDNIWLMTPLLDGEEIKRTFRNIPPGTSFKLIMSAQEKWMLRNPHSASSSSTHEAVSVYNGDVGTTGDGEDRKSSSGAVEDCRQFLVSTFPQFL